MFNLISEGLFKGIMIFFSAISTAIFFICEKIGFGTVGKILHIVK